MLRRILAWHSRFHKSGHQAKRNGVLHETLREADRLAEEVFVATYAVVLRASVKDVSQMSGRSRQCCSSVRTYVHNGSPTKARLLARATIRSMVGKTSTLVHSVMHARQPIDDDNRPGASESKM